MSAVPLNKPLLSLKNLLLALGLSLILPATACRKQTPGPEETLEQFISSLSSRRAKQAYGMLSEDSRKQLKARRDRLAKAAGIEAKYDPFQMLFQDMDLVVLGSPGKPVVVSPVGDRMRLRVPLKTEGMKEGQPMASAEFDVVKEAGAWKVDLAGALTSTSAH